ncbi:hypothetical protein P691DRAFT_698441 [Macrolepiota fuliginosa MF-IS2]|uniref:Uncharacterized protein n=1 Tax=Macrolepiota fuliginosa MF-IS2 TaxID=1400762 RepID=A0A9P5XK22_9AGAR|nr:hypothetical protein P691DRAFT_698441 [Macrolepiota fuliginosa MF-IS2]
MFWCIPLPFSLSGQPKRMKSTSSSPARMKPISGPVGLEDQTRRMQFQRHHPDAAASDSGPFYLVPNKHGPGKSIIRRTPLPPPPPQPAEDDYDNITQAPTTMAQKGDTIDWPGRTRGSPIGVSSAHMEDNFDAATYTAPGGADSNTDSAWRTPSNRTRDRAPPRGPVSPRERYFPAKARTNTPSPVSGSRTAHDTVENYGDYGLYMQEMERIFKAQGEVEVGVERNVPDMDQAERRDLARIRSREVTRNNPITRSPNPGHTVTYHPRFDTGAHHGVNPGARNRRRGPRAGQELEVVNRKVVEDTPEKTVTISTWREQVARETSPNDVETMSIHYMGLEDYAAAERTMTEVDSNVQSAQRTLHETGRSDSIRSTRPADEPSKDVIQPAADSEESTSPIEPEAHRPPTPPQKSSSNLQQTRSVSSNSRNHSTPPRITTPERPPMPKNNPRSPRAGMRRIMPAFHDSTPPPEVPRSPSPSHTPTHAYAYNIQSSSPTGINPNVFGTNHNPQSPLQESTPIRASMSPIPFHPRQSQGSTISSIKSESAVLFEQLLDSCQPSLLHILPVLTRLGITKVEHLKAVTRLSEEMRDREVREEALRMGVTVVEWAILLDKVGML